MTDLHPHWHSTETGRPMSTGTHVPINGRVPRAGKLRTVSRMPAALLGIALIAVGGFTAVQGWDALWGQLTIPPPMGGTPGMNEIHVQPTGPIPPSLQVEQGDTITWINDDTIPHILKSDTLKGINSDALYTGSIFPGSRFTFTVSPTQASGTYDYTSLTSPTITGTITVTLKSSGGPTTSSSPMSAFGGTEGVPLPGLHPSAPIAPAMGMSTPAQTQNSPVEKNNMLVIQANDAESPTSSSSVAGVERTPQDLPYNPYTVASTNVRGRLVPQSIVQSPSAVLHSGAPSQPESGPEVWIVLFGSIAALLMVTRRQLRAYTIRL